MKSCILLYPRPTIKHWDVLNIMKSKILTITRKLSYQSSFIEKVSYKNTKWICPAGYPTGIQVYNCVAGEKVPLILKDKHLTWYSCGPTVYDSAHIGHASSYMKIDIIQRILQNYFKISIISSMGVTDIDDKIIIKAKETGIPYTSIVKYYENEFWLDLHRLNIKKPNIICRVTDNIDCIENFIKKLILNNKAYITSDGSVYFDTNKYNNYGKLQKLPETLKNSEMGKKNESDFALWKGYKPDEPFWSVEWGKGRPGWHIECSAMVSRLFGPQVDIHAGGIDLQFPHHENEEAQSCSFHENNQWVNYWLHTGHLHVPGDVKMSKSLKNTISISKILQEYSPHTFRMACLMSHYRYPMEYSDKLIKSSESVLNKIKHFLNDCEIYLNKPTNKESKENEHLKSFLSKCEQVISESLKDDFDTSKCINTILKLISETNKVIKSENGSFHPVEVTSIHNWVSDMLSVFGLCLKSNQEGDKNVTTLIDAVVELRHTVRLQAVASKNKELLVACDVTRDKLRAMNVQINDKGDVSSWIFIK